MFSMAAGVGLDGLLPPMTAECVDEAHAEAVAASGASANAKSCLLFPLSAMLDRRAGKKAMATRKLGSMRRALNAVLR